jgi:hypothetical protein
MMYLWTGEYSPQHSRPTTTTGVLAWHSPSYLHSSPTLCRVSTPGPGAYKPIQCATTPGLSLHMIRAVHTCHLEEGSCSLIQCQQRREPQGIAIILVAREFCVDGLICHKQPPVVDPTHRPWSSGGKWTVVLDNHGKM